MNEKTQQGFFELLNYAYIFLSFFIYLRPNPNNQLKQWTRTTKFSNFLLGTSNVRHCLVARLCLSNSFSKNTQFDFQSACLDCKRQRKQGTCSV